MDNAVLVVGFAGPIGSGKNECARAIRGAVVMEFSDPIYAMLGAMLGINPAELKRRDRKDQPIPLTGKSVRQLLVSLGTEWGRELVREDVWVRHLVCRARVLADAGATAIAVAGVRFENEIVALRDMGGVVLWVDNQAAAEAAAAAPTATHKSERSIGPGDCDSVVDNNGSIEELPMRVSMAIADAFARRRVREASDGV